MSALEYYQDPLLIALSFAVALLASYAALDMADRLQAGSHGANFWLWSSALVLGVGIWAAHFIGARAFCGKPAQGYDADLTLLSLLMAIVSVAGSLGLMSRHPVPTRDRLLVAGLLLGVGTVSMHLVGMAATRTTAEIQSDPLLSSLSLLLSIAAIAGAFWLAITFNLIRHRVAAALSLALALCLTDYATLASALIQTGAAPDFSESLFGTPLTTIMVAIMTVGLMTVALICMSVDHPFQARSEGETTALRTANMRLQAEIEEREAAEARLQALNEELEARTQDLEATRKEVIRRLGAAGEYRDNETGQHVLRMSLFAHQLALAAGLSPDDAAMIRDAAPMHDIGKIGIPDAILLKPGNLTAFERDIMRRHTVIGGEILAGSGFALLDLARVIALTHHERWDGSGYPLGLSGQEIPLAGRIVAIADVFDALTSARPYKEPWSVKDAVQFLVSNAGSQFDSRLTTLFVQELPKILALKELFPEPAAHHPESGGPWLYRVSESLARVPERRSA